MSAFACEGIRMLGTDQGDRDGQTDIQRERERERERREKERERREREKREKR